jgi:hypothetical protein
MRYLQNDVFEKIIERQANRLVRFSDLTKEMMMSITDEDI